MKRLLAWIWLGIGVVSTTCGVGWADVASGGEDRVVVRLGSDAEIGDGSGRLLLLMASDGSGGEPLSAPFWNDPQPIYSIAVDGVSDESVWVIDDSASGAFPGPISKLDGTYRVRAVLDVDQTTSGFGLSDRNWMSDERVVRFSPGDDDVIELEITQRLPVREIENTERVKEARLRSERLSAFFGRDVFLRAGVILPEGYAADGERRYPVVYEIPGFGEQHGSAWRRGRVPEVFDEGVVWIVLDADGPFGHHLFFNSANNGPVGDALVEEFIPYLEDAFRLIALPEARVLTGHSSGGFASAWLQIRYPTFFGGCWATGPDPLDFRAFQVINVYEDANAFVDAEGLARPSVQMGGDVVCTIAQENGMEHAMDPTGASGQQWSSWMACFSPRGADGKPVPLWNMRTGAIDANVRQHWARNDPRRYVESNWDSIGALLSDRLHIICGAADNFSLGLATAQLKSTLASLPGWPEPDGKTTDGRARGYVEIVEGGTHFNLRGLGVTRRVYREMRNHFEAHGFLEGPR